MAKQLNVNLSFNADTSQAKAQIQALSKSLQDIAKMPGNASNLFDDTQIKKASQAALELQQHLSKAVNVDTGKLDLSRFSSSLKTSNKDLSIYCDTLLSTGEKGQQAFLQLAQAIATADTPVTRVNKKLAEMGTALKNTARWQISSSILHGFMGAVQSAYNYAQDLNESLNEIRIVTGQNIEQMSKFATEANRAARALSTTTTEYTDASLIYYQQGLSDSEVAKRTEVTIKMANAAGQSAQVVSDQLTAIWNNFYDGSKSLEYYADVMTALGAATASSTDEIAGGLEKFAAIGETIGLSYEYAASALATITSNTRQSEEVVGTALKTIFARIQGLNLGETLDDGVTLNKYSEALQKVGISIFDSAGELKNMDTILDEMGAKWETLNKSQQVALAQTVAGTRQYTQLVALMDNWNNGDNDSMAANLSTAYGSEGALQEQADIYAESWEAAQDRVTAAAEHIYSSLINDEFFIDLLNGFEKVLETVGGFIDGLGGLKGVIGVVGSVFLTHFAKQMPETLENLRQNVMVFTGQAQKEMVKVQDTMSAKIAVQKAAPGASESFKLQAEGIESVSKMKQKLILESKNLTTQEKADYEARIKNVEAMYDEAAALAKLVDEQKKQADTSADALADNAVKDAQGLYSSLNKATSEQEQITTMGLAAADDDSNVEFEKQIAAYEKAGQAIDEYDAKISKMIATYAKLGVAIEKADGEGLDPDKYKEMSAAVKKVTEQYKAQVTQYKKLDVLQSDIKSQTANWSKYASEIDKSESAVKELKVSMTGYKTAIQGIADETGLAFPTAAVEKLDAVLQNPKSSAQECAQAFEEFSAAIGPELKTRLDTLTQDLQETDATLDGLGLSSDGLKNMRTSAESAAEGVTKLALSTGNIKGQVDAGIDSTFKASVAFTEFGAAAMSVSTTISSIQNMISVFTDEGATGFEKMGAAISALVAVMSAYNAVQAFATTLKKSDTVTTLLQTAGTKLKQVADKGETAGIWAKVAAYIAEQIAAAPVLVITLALVAAFVALAAIVAVVVSVVNAISNAYNKDAIAAEKAEASARALSEAYNEAKQSYEDMISAMEEYKSARESLDSLTEGTKEYQEALEQANRAALELINNNPDMFKAGEDYHWENGELIIDDDAMTRAQQTASARESQVYAAMQMGQAEAKEARNVADETALRRELVKDSTTGSDYLAGALTGAFSSAALGTVIATALGGPIGLAIGGALMSSQALGGAALGGAAMTGTLESKKLEESGALDKTLAQLKKDSSFLDSGADNIKATLNIDDDDIINALIENKDALLELSEAQEAQAQQEKLAAQQSANEILQNSQYSDMSDEMTYMGGAVFQEATDKAYDALLESMDSKGGLKAGANAYFESQGISDKDGFKVEKYDAKNGTVSYSYLDESGQRQELEVTAEQIAMTQAVVVAQQELLASCEAMEDTFNALDADIKDADSSTKLLSEGMKAFLTSGDTGQLTKEQYDAMAGMDSAEMKEYLASIGINDSNITDFGYDNVDSMVNDMDLTSTGDQWAQYQNITAHQGTENLTLDQAENINNALKDVADFFGEEVGHEMLDLSAAMADSLDEAAQDDFWEQLGNISDYADADQWDGFLEAMKESGELTEEQEKALEDYVDTAKLAAKATKDLNFDEMAESVASLRDIMNNISEGQREISDEEFAALEAQGIDTSKFAKTIDGYRYLGDSADLVADISEGITSQFKEAEQNFANIAATAQQASQNLIDAEAELAAAKEAGDRTRASAEAGAQNQMSNTEKLSVIMSNIVNNVVSKIKSAWDWICGVMMDIYDFFVNIFNKIGQGITDVWNGFLQAISDIINGSIGGIMEWIEDTFDIDTGWDDIEFEKAEFTAAKTTEEVEAEENAKKAEQDLIASTQALADAIPDMVASIESSADYLSEAELEAGRAEAETNYNTAMADYDAAVATYGADSTQAQYYEQLVAYYEAQMDAYAKALDSKAWGEVIAEGIDTKEMESYIDLLEQAHPEMKELYETTEDYENALLQVATANKKMEKGVKSLSSNWDSWNDIMSDSEASASDIATILPDVNDALQDVLNLDTEEFAMLPPDFAQKHWDLIQDVVNGVEGSVDTLRNMAGQEILMTIDGVVDPDGNIDAEFLALHEKIASFDQSQFTVGVAIDHNAHADFIAACNDIIQKAGMTAEQAQAYFASMGYDVKLKPVKQQVTETQWNHVYRNLYDAKGNPAGRVIERAWPSTFTGEVDALAIETITPNGSYGGGIGVETTAPKTSRSNASQSGGGGSSHDPETVEKRDTTKKSDTVERYREVSDAIDNVTDALTRAERATDRLWGKDKLAAMREENKILEQQRQLLLDKAEEAEKYAKEDAKNLRKVADDIGVSIVIDEETGDITNIEDVESTLHDRLAAAETEYNAKVEAYNKAVAQAKADGTVTDEENDKLEKMKDALDAYENDVIGDIEKDIEAWEDAEQQFQESIETWEDAGFEAEEILDQIMQNNYDIIMEGLEIPLSLNEEDLRLIELQLSQIEDDVYSMAEAVALTSSQFGEYQDNLRLADEALAELNRAHEAGEITDAAYQEGLGEIRDKYYENVEALMELDNTMMDYYSNTIDMANEELSKYTDQIEHQTSVLEHYSSLIELMGKSNDYKMMGKVLEGQVKTTKDAMTVSKQWYETQRANADSLAAEYAAAQARGASDEELELIKKNWDAAEASANEAQDKMLSDAEAWAEALRAVLENKLSELGQTLENALTGGTSFDTINTQWERAQSLQEEYLTTTNQIYETNKLMRTAQQEIDKTTNSVAKKKLQAYIAETEQLQSQSKLSQYELDIQKAKYDLLLAEIALEEAQDAKSTVRLQRDSEGNFGYVYTADQNKLAEAQQQLEDAQNSLYNIGLEGANDYAQKYQQTMQEMYDTFADLQQQKLDGAFETEEEYHRAMEKAKAYYYQKLQDYSGLYSVAVTTDSRVVADAWSSDFADMVYDTDEWMSAVDQYVADVELAFKEWSDAVHDPTTGLTAIVGGDVAAVGEKVQEVTDKSAELAKKTVDEVIPALDEELDYVQNMTGAYANMRKEIQAVIEEYTNMINRINNSQTNEWNNGDSGDGDTSGGGDEGAGSGDGGTGGGDEGSGGNTGGGDEDSGAGAGGEETSSDSYRYGTVEFRGNGADRIWIDEAGKQYAYNSSQGKKLQAAFNSAFNRNGGYKGDYWIGWTDTGGKLKADILREKDGLATGGYTGEWAGSYGKLALLHQKELVLNASDTENLLTSMEVLNKIVEMIDLQSMSSQLGGLLNSPSLGLHSSEVLEQNVHIEASFPGVQDRSEIEEAFNNLINKASQFANRK